MNYRNFLLIPALALPFMLAAGNLSAQQEQPAAVVAPADNLQQARQQLQSIQQSLVEKRGQLVQLRQQLNELTDSGEREDLQKQISQEELDMSMLRRSFENIALGGVDSSVFDPASQDQSFDWQQELKLILEPLFQKMRELTEKPRQIEQLKSYIAVLEDKQQVINRALENLDRLRTDELNVATLQWLDVIRQAWTQQGNDVQRERDITRLRLDVMLDDTDTLLNRVRTSIGEFISGTGRNLALSLGAFVVTWLLMKWLFFLNIRFSKRNTMRLSTARRILTYGYHALTLLVSVLAALAVLYMLGDTVLFAIAIILLVFALLGLRNRLPFIVEETRMLLNVGPVREHEKVIYRDLPWMVRSLGVYSYLNNPALEGVLRLPMTEMTGLVSRPCRDDELWFPTRMNDWVLFPDGSMGQILRQTPDTVQMRIGGSTVTYDTAVFMNEKMRNLSNGYNVGITFGIDYKHQSASTAEIPEILKNHVEQALRQVEFGKHAESVLVEFKEAAPSSLNYLVAVSMNGTAADSYFTLNRLLQRACVDCCNANNWVIPFNQLTLNAGAGFDLSGAAGLKAR